MTPVEAKNAKSHGIEIEIQLNTADARARLDNLAAHVTAVNELLDGTLNRLERVAKIMPSKKFDAIQEMQNGLPPTEGYIRSLAEMLKISCPLIDAVSYCLRPGGSTYAGDGSEIKIIYKNGNGVRIPIAGTGRLDILMTVTEVVYRYTLDQVSPNA
nr:MAG TPA: hypothetical protein [Caudoviricetes sp.]